MNTTDEKVLFWRWWEKRRIAFNVIVFMFLFLMITLFGGLSKIGSIPIKVPTAIFIYTNIFYSIPTLIWFISKLMLGTYNVGKESFFQKKKFWELMFFLGLFVFLTGLFFLFIIGSSLIPRPMNQIIVY